MFDQFLYHSIDTREDLIDAYLVGNRLVKFLSRILPTHKVYLTEHQNLRQKSYECFNDVKQYLKCMERLIDEQEFQAQVCPILDNSMQTEATEESRKSNASSRKEFLDQELKSNKNMNDDERASLVALMKSTPETKTNSFFAETKITDEIKPFDEVKIFDEIRPFDEIKSLDAPKPLNIFEDKLDLNAGFDRNNLDDSKSNTSNEIMEIEMKIRECPDLSTTTSAHRSFQKVTEILWKRSDEKDNCVDLKTMTLSHPVSQSIDNLNKFDKVEFNNKQSRHPSANVLNNVSKSQVFPKTHSFLRQTSNIESSTNRKLASPEKFNNASKTACKTKDDMQLRNKSEFDIEVPVGWATFDQEGNDDATNPSWFNASQLAVTSTIYGNCDSHEFEPPKQVIARHNKKGKVHLKDVELVPVHTTDPFDTGSKPFNVSSTLSSIELQVSTCDDNLFKGSTKSRTLSLAEHRFIQCGTAMKPIRGVDSGDSRPVCSTHLATNVRNKSLPRKTSSISTRFCSNTISSYPISEDAMFEYDRADDRRKITMILGCLRPKTSSFL